MKRVHVVFAVLLTTVALASAQGPIGLMVSETAGPKAPGAKVLSGGITIGDDSEFFGGRFSAALSEQVLLFADLGIVDLDDVDEQDPGLQLGAIVTIPADAPVDLAARAAYATAFFDDVDYYSLSAMLLAGKDLTTNVRGLSVYGGVGLFYWETEYDDDVRRGLGVNKEADDTELAVVVGAILDVTDRLDVYMEFDQVDDSFFGGGVRWSL